MPLENSFSPIPLPTRRACTWSQAATTRFTRFGGSRPYISRLRNSNRSKKESGAAFEPEGRTPALPSLMSTPPPDRQNARSNAPFTSSLALRTISESSICLRYRHTRNHRSLASDKRNDLSGCSDIHIFRASIRAPCQVFSGTLTLSNNSTARFSKSVIGEKGHPAFSTSPTVSSSPLPAPRRSRARASRRPTPSTGEANGSDRTESPATHRPARQQQTRSSFTPQTNSLTSRRSSPRA